MYNDLAIYVLMFHVDICKTAADATAAQLAGGLHQARTSKMTFQGSMARARNTLHSRYIMNSR